MKKLRAVLDTNVVVSALVFAHGRLSWIRESWSSERFIPLASKSTVLELLRVLAYPKFNLSHREREDLLAEYLPFCEIVKVERAPEALPKSRDPNDQMFLELAIAGDADVIVTGDDDLLAMTGVDVEIVTPGAFRERGELNDER